MWFDSSSIANLAKSALKEAQKHIDNVLDIKDDDMTETNNEESRLTKSKTLPSIQQEAKKEETISVWGSFNGSFFENKPSQPGIITNPPPRKSETSSESLEIISKSPSSSASLQDISSSQSTLQGSVDESVEIINKTSSNVDISSPIQADLLSPIDLYTDSSNSALMTPQDTDDIPITLPPTRSNNSLEIDTSTTIISTSTLTNSECGSSFCDPSNDDLDQTLKAINNSNIMEKSMESFEIQTQVSDSTHSFEEINPSKVKNIPSNNAGKSTESKPGSGHTSSGDELETATSSDIEIISSPNGDSSSTASCPKATSASKKDSSFPYQNSESYLANLKLDHKGHSRELSEVSVLSLASDECASPSDTEKLLKRISELNENLEQREVQLVQMGRSNAELTDVNVKLSQELDAIKRGRNSLDMTNLQEEYTQRLSALEKKFQQSIRDNSMLKKQLETMKVEMESKVSVHEYDKMATEKDSIIDTLKNEGEKLSKQILQHSNAIKKLKAKLKENDELIKRQDSQITELTDENQKLKKNLTTKDEIEKSQSDGINKLTNDKRKFEKENQQLKSQNEDLQQKVLALQTSHDALKKELSEKSVEMGRNLEDEKEKALNESKLLKKELTELREINRINESSATSREQKLRQENLELKRKLEETEFRIEDQKQEASLASIPLIRQLESLQSTLNSRTALWENQERVLLEKLEAAQNKLSSQSDVEKQAKDQVMHLNIKISNLEEKLSSTSLKLEQTLSQLQQKDIEFNLHENDYKLKIEQLLAEVSSKSTDTEKFKNLVSQLEEKLRTERSEFEDEKRKLLFIQQQNQHHHPHAERQDSNDLGNDSPVLSLGSVESLHSHPWNMDDHDVGANSNYSSQYGGVVNSSASLMEGLQSILKQRDGEVQQLQWEIHRLQTERNFLSNEISNLTSEFEKATEQIKEQSEKQRKQDEDQVQYNALLEMYGQKAEEYEELKLDLIDLKSISQMYKKQIDELTQKLNDIEKKPKNT
ncbi:TATA element modulatory factor [Chironomus tepperi]|uniref:TATA element modulatory factor n=1 Tax=Chironomus tepperi TaxID=113505 RepID=UPI00391F208A